MTGEDSSGTRQTGSQRLPEVSEPQQAEPKRVATIDIGATSVRMKVVELRDLKTINELESLVHPIALGMDTFRTGVLSLKTVAVLSAILRKFAQILKEYDVEHYRAVATSSVREATNRDVVVDRLRHDSGLEITLLEPEEESRLVYQMVVPFLRRSRISTKRNTLVFDLGGGCTEAMVLQGDRLIHGGSKRLGIARLMYGIADADSSDSRALLQNLVRSTLTSLYDNLKGIPLHTSVIINGVLRRFMESEESAKEIPGGLSIKASKLAGIAKEATSLSIDGISERFGMTRGDAELFLPISLVLHHLLTHQAVKRVLVPHLDFSGAILTDLTQELSGQAGRAAFRKEMLSSAGALARRYSADMAHARQVQRLAFRLFDALAHFLDLTDEDRFMLGLGALLHDIGRFISDRDHHKHGFYIVQWSEIVGLGEKDRNLVSLIVRYHRRKRPSTQQSDFAALSTEDRLRVAKLAAILRVADALDRSHDQAITSLEVKLTESEMGLAVCSKRDLAVEMSAIEEKTTLFQDLTGMKVRLWRDVK